MSHVAEWEGGSLKWIGLLVVLDRDDKNHVQQQREWTDHSSSDRSSDKWGSLENNIVVSPSC